MLQTKCPPLAPVLMCLGYQQPAVGLWNGDLPSSIACARSLRPRAVLVGTRFFSFLSLKPGFIGGRMRSNDGGWRSTDVGWPMADSSYSPAGTLCRFERTGGWQFCFYLPGPPSQPCPLPALCPRPPSAPMSSKSTTISRMPPSKCWSLQSPTVAGVPDVRACA